MRPIILPKVCNSKGFTLTELIIVMAIFISIIMITGNAFENILGKAVQATKRTESNIEGIVGLELLRSDIEHAGYGLFWSFPPGASVPAYAEVAANTQLALGVVSSDFNDTSSNAPRAIISGISTKEVSGDDGINGGLGPDYLVVKSTVAAINNAAKKWSYVNYSSSGGTNKSYIRKWGAADDITNKDRVITISSTFSTSGQQDKQLMVNSANAFFYVVNGVEPVDAAFKPGDATQLFLVYGINSPGNTTTALTMPYNRADFYVKRPTDSGDIPKACNPKTGVLYKAVANNNGAGGVQQYPLLDCVGDMQVIFETASGFSEAPGTTAADIRAQLRSVKVYILAHEGQFDRNYTYPDAEISLKEGGLGRTWTAQNMEDVFGDNWRNYRWKVYTIVARPKNLN